MEKQRLPGDPTLIENIVNYLKAKGIFDEFRHECLADVDTKSSCQNLSQRVDGYTAKFLSTETWNPDLNKNELRNKLRRHIDESGTLAVGADHVVEQVINPKIHQFFLPRIREVVYQYLNEENEKLSKKTETAVDEAADKNSDENLEANSSKSSKPVLLDPVADILAFSYSKPKPMNQSVSYNKVEAAQTKIHDASKLDKKKEDKLISHVGKSEVLEKKKDDKAILQLQRSDSIEKKKEEKMVSQFVKVENSVSATDSVCRKEEKPLSMVIKSEITEKLELENIKTEPVEPSNESKVDPSTVAVMSHSENTDVGKEKKLEACESALDVLKKNKKEDSKPERKKPDDSKSSTELAFSSEDSNFNKSSNTLVSAKPNISNKSKSDHGKSKVKQKVHNLPLKSSRSNDNQKLKSKDSNDSLSKSSEKVTKSSLKSFKTPLKDSSSPNTKSKDMHSSKTKTSDSTLNKSLDISIKKNFKSSSSAKGSVTKAKSNIDKSEKLKVSKADQKGGFSQQHNASNLGKGSRSSIQYSSQDSSQGSDQDKTSTAVKPKERQKHFRKSIKKERSCRKLDFPTSKTTVDGKHSKISETKVSKEQRKVKHSKTSRVSERSKETKSGHEIAKISSRSNSFGSTSSVSSVSNASKDNSISPSDESADSSKLQKKKLKKSSSNPCHTPENFQPPPPPPPPSSSLACTTSTNVLSTEETQSSPESEESDSGSISKSRSESDNGSMSETVRTNVISPREPETLNDLYDMFLYSSSSSEFEGFCSSPEKIKNSKDSAEDSDSVSSVHTSDLSSFDNELSVGDTSSDENTYPETRAIKKRLSLKEAQGIITVKTEHPSSSSKKNASHGAQTENNSFNDDSHGGQLNFSSDEEICSPSKPTRELRRARKLNPKYASSEYASIFSSKANFLTKQIASEEQNQDIDFDANSEKNRTSIEILPDKVKASLKRSPVVTPEKNAASQVTESKAKTRNSPLTHASQSDVKKIKSETNDNDPEEMHLKNNTLKDAFHSNASDHSKSLRSNKTVAESGTKISSEGKSHSLKRKHESVEKEDASNHKRPCSRSSIDSSNSEFSANENKPFNNERRSFRFRQKNKVQNECKDITLIDNRTKDNSFKQKANNNGNFLHKKEVLRKNSK